MSTSEPTIDQAHEASASVDEARSLADLGGKACEAYDRPDLGKRVEAAAQRLDDPSTRVLVVGEFKQGKSSLVNALLNASICPVDDDIATCVPTAVGYADDPAALAVYEPEDDDAEPATEPVDPDQLTDYVSEWGNPANERRLRMVEVGLPRRLLGSGLTLVDTPGVGGLGSVHGALTVGALPSADAVLLVTDASQELTEPELRFLKSARELCPTVACALTKTDLYPEWRKVLKLDRGHLDEHGFGEVEIMPVSSMLRVHALRTEDRSLNEESGFARLVGFLRDGVIDAAEQLSVRTAANAVLQVGRHLRVQFETEREALGDPEAAARLERELEEAQERAERLKSESARWQTTLNDGVADLNSDIDHDLRGRTRQIIQDAELRIDDGDPAEWWEEFDTWLRQRLGEEVVENYTYLTRRADELAETVAEHFAAAEEDVEVGVEAPAPVEMLQQLPAPEPDMPGVSHGMKAKAAGAANKGFGAIRGAYGGMFMFRTLGGMIGLGAMNPAVLGLTLLMGRKSMRDQRNQELQKRRQQAKGAVRKFVDEANFQVGKDSRDTLRRVQRQLRDGFTERAEEIQRTVSERLSATQQAVQSEQSNREQRLKDVDAELERLGKLVGRAEALAPDLAARAAGEAPA